MAVRSIRWRWKALAAGCCLASSVVWLAGATATTNGTGRPSEAYGPAVAGGADQPALRALQLNLCDSGLASCYTGRSVRVAAALIRADRPDIVTLNEVCREDVARLKRAMSATGRDTTVASAFEAAVDRRTDGPFRCRNGQPYGIGVLASVRSSRYRAYGGVYPIQDVADPEERVWLCIHAPGEYYACSTHAASTSTTIALTQCRYFLAAAVPSMRGREGDDPVIAGADLNLPAGHSPGPQSCLPAGYQRVDDGDRQDVVTGPGASLRSRAIIDLHRSTDHPGLLVRITDVVGVHATHPHDR